MYRAIIIDDELLAIDVIQHYLDKFSQFEVVATFSNSVEALSFLNENPVDIAFTDIAMPGISGTELVGLANSRTKFVMVTSFADYAIESFDLDVIDYLLKPVSFPRFTKAIERFKQNHKNAIADHLRPSFFIKEGDEFIKLAVADIDYIEGLKDYAKIVSGNNYCMALKTLKSIEKILKPYGFMRIHKSYIIPLHKITQFNVRCVLINTTEIPVGDHYKESLKEYLNKNRL